MTVKCMHCIHFEPLELVMGMLTIRNIDDDLKARLRLKAAEAGCSIEETVRVILRQATAANASGVAPAGVDAPRAAARRRLLDHLAQVQPSGSRQWSRDELYD